MRFVYSRTFSIIAISIVVISLFTILDAKGYSGFVKDGFNQTYGYSVKTVSSWTKSVKGFFATLVTIKNLARDNAEANQKINELAFENAKLSSAKQENTTLRRALEYKEQSGLSLISVQTLNSDPTGFNQTITIDKGEKDGVRVFSAVIAAPGLLVGKVTKTHSSTSEVTLLTDPSMIVNAEVADSGARGLIKGEHGLTLGFDLITQNELIKAQDRVITSGLSSDYPRGLLIGEVVSIRSSSQELFQKAFVTPAVDLRNLKFLFVIRE